MEITRKLEEVHQDLTLLAEQERAKGFFYNVENADKLGGLVEDIRDAMMEYQVRMQNCSFPPRLTFTPDFVATRYLQQELSAHCESCLLISCPRRLIDE